MIGTVLAPRPLLIEAGAFRYPELTGRRSGELAEDFELWLLLALRGTRFHYLDEPLAVYHRHDDSLTSDWPTILFSIAAVLDGLVPEAQGGDRRLLRGEGRKMREVAFRKLAWRRILAGETGAARVELVRSLRACPYSPRAWLALGALACPPLARRLVQDRV